VEQMMITTRQRNITTHFGTMVRHARGKVKGQEVERALKTEEEEEKKEETRRRRSTKATKEKKERSEDKEEKEEKRTRNEQATSSGGV
jgi:hypothetical protein